MIPKPANGSWEEFAVLCKVLFPNFLKYLVHKIHGAQTGKKTVQDDIMDTITCDPSHQLTVKFGQSWS